MTMRRNKKNAQKPISPQASVTHGEIWQLEGLASRLRAARIMAGYLRPSEFAEACGVSRQYLCNLETDKVRRPEALPLMKIARTAGVSMEWLLTGHEPENDT